jgi:LysR substrate binding domain
MQRGHLDDLLAFIAVGQERSRSEAGRLAVGTELYDQRTRGPAGSSTPDEDHPKRVSNASWRTSAAQRTRLEEIAAELQAVAELREKPAGTVRITATEFAIDTVLLPKLARLLREYPDIKVELIVDYGLTDIVAEKYDAGVRSGEQIIASAASTCVKPLSIARFR